MHAWHITNGKMIFCLSASHTRQQSVFIRRSLFKMQVFVIRCDDWLSDSWMYWWGNWFWRNDWQPEKRSLLTSKLRKEIRRASGNKFAMQWHKKRKPQSFGEKMRCYWRCTEKWGYTQTRSIYLKRIRLLLLLWVIYVYIFFIDFSFRLFTILMTFYAL